jgi:hypothetical protein
LVYLQRGITSFAIANFGIGAIGTAIFLVLLFWRSPRLNNWLDIWQSKDNSASIDRSMLGVLMGSVAGLTLLASIFLTPEAFYWSPNTGMLPRFNYYSFGVSIVALASLVVAVTDKLAVLWRFALPSAVLLIACLDITGIVSVPLAFDYGELSLVWK